MCYHVAGKRVPCCVRDQAGRWYAPTPSKRDPDSGHRGQAPPARGSPHGVQEEPTCRGQVQTGRHLTARRGNRRGSRGVWHSSVFSRLPTRLPPVHCRWLIAAGSLPPVHRITEDRVENVPGLSGRVGEKCARRTSVREGGGRLPPKPPLASWAFVCGGSCMGVGLQIPAVVGAFPERRRAHLLPSPAVKAGKKTTRRRWRPGWYRAWVQGSGWLGRVRLSRV